MEEGTQTEGQGEIQTQEVSHWTDGLENADLKNNPTLKKYESQEEANRGHLKLQESFGMEKQVWPKDENDTERWAEVNKRLGVPEKADGYGLKAISNPEGVELFDRVKFQDMMLESGAPQAVADKLWEGYTGRVKEGYAEAQAKFDENVAASKANLMAKWGESYESKVKAGEHVIDTLGNSQEQKDALTVALSQSSEGIEFLADISKMFVESSIGGFQEKANFTLSPSEARTEIDRIRQSDDYNSDSEKIRAPLIERMNALMSMANPGM